MFCDHATFNCLKMTWTLFSRRWEYLDPLFCLSEDKLAYRGLCPHNRSMFYHLYHCWVRYRPLLHQRWMLIYSA